MMFCSAYKINRFFEENLEISQSKQKQIKSPRISACRYNALEHVGLFPFSICFVHPTFVTKVESVTYMWLCLVFAQLALYDEDVMMI